MRLPRLHGNDAVVPEARRGAPRAVLALLAACGVLRAPAMSNFADALLRDAHRVDVYNNS